MVKHKSRLKEVRNIQYRVKTRKANWIGQILCSNCLIEHIIEEKLEERTEHRLVLRKDRRYEKTRKKT